MSTRKGIRKTFPKMREFFKECGITLTYEHFMHHIDEKTGDEYDCLHEMPCKCKLALMEKQKVAQTPEA